MAKSHSKNDAPHPTRSAAARHPLPAGGERDKLSAGRDNSEIDFTQINFDPHSETLDDDYEAFHKRKKTLPEAKAQAIEAQFQATFARERDENRRFVNNVFQFWIVCTHQACKRLSGCADDPYACHARWWPVTAERHKVRYRAYVRARAEGSSHDQAWAFAKAEVKRLADHIARVEAEQHARLDALEAAERAQCEVAIAVAIKAAPCASPAAEANAAQPLRREHERGPRVSVL